MITRSGDGLGSLRGGQVHSSSVAASSAMDAGAERTPAQTQQPPEAIYLTGCQAGVDWYQSSIVARCMTPVSRSIVSSCVS